MDVLVEPYYQTPAEYELQQLATQGKATALVSYTAELGGAHRAPEQPEPLFEVGIDSAETITAVAAEQARDERLRHPHFPSATVGMEDYIERPAAHDAATGPIGALAMFIHAPGDAADYQAQYDQREISRTDFVLRMTAETAQAHMESVRTNARQAGAFLSRAFKSAREAVASWGKEVPQKLGVHLGSTAVQGAGIIEDTVELHTV